MAYRKQELASHFPLLRYFWRILFSLKEYIFLGYREIETALFTYFCFAKANVHMLTYEIRWLLARCAKENPQCIPAQVCRLNSSKEYSILLFFLAKKYGLLFSLALHTRCIKPIWIRENIFIFLFILWYIVFSGLPCCVMCMVKLCWFICFWKMKIFLYDHSCVRHSRRIKYVQLKIP